MKLLLVGLLMSLALPLTAAEKTEIDVSNLKSSADLTLELDLEGFDLEAEMEMDAQMEAQSLSGTELLSRPPRRGRRRPPRYDNPRRRPIYRPRPPRREVVCVSENGRGRRFRARAYRPYRAEMKSLRKCERNSYYPRSCMVLGCRRARR